MPNPTMHPFEQAPDGDWCDAPDTDGRTCARLDDHPIHSGRADVDGLARALLAQQWRSDDTRLAQMSEHRRHNYSSDCAICVGDVHQIAAAVLDISAEILEEAIRVAEDQHKRENDPTSKYWGFRLYAKAAADALMDDDIVDHATTALVAEGWPLGVSAEEIVRVVLRSVGSA